MCTLIHAKLLTHSLIRDARQYIYTHTHSHTHLHMLSLSLSLSLSRYLSLSLSLSLLSLSLSRIKLLTNSCNILHARCTRFQSQGLHTVVCVRMCLCVHICIHIVWRCVFTNHILHTFKCMLYIYISNTKTLRCTIESSMNICMYIYLFIYTYI